MYTFDNKSIMRNGKRWFPIMGEIHYSRYPKQYWKESLCKMKAGGIDIVSAYAIWIHHEEIEGEYDFSGDRDLHGFVQACKDCDIKLLLRLGPWVHGEVRNGGFPDWLLKKDFQVRTNDEKYFSVVEKWYKKLFEQVAEFFELSEDENPIIGVQIENEFGHCGGLYDESGEVHMQRLQKMAQQIGFKVPLYTATGWGGARTGGMLPVMGGYCDAPWDPRITEIEPSGNYIFTYERNDHNIGSDYGLGEGITFDTSKFPYLTAELGGGLQVTHHRRTIAESTDIGAVALTKLGSGVNLLGYYMYHGGTNPEGKLTTLQESKETGYPNDLPEKSYDFRAPIREYGQISRTLRELKLYAYFVHDYGQKFCEMDAKVPADNPLLPDDIQHLRYSFRTDGKSGYAFVNNYVRLRNMPEFKNLSIKTPEGVEFPPVCIKNKEYFFWPYNIEYGKYKVKTATVTPLCSLKNGPYVFYNAQSDSRDSEFFQLEDSNQKPDFLVLKKEDALNTWKTKNGGIVITDGSFIQNHNGKEILTVRSNSVLYAYPELESSSDKIKKIAEENKNIARDLPAFNFAVYEHKKVPESINNAVDFKEVTPFSKQSEKAVYKIVASSLVKKFEALSKENVSDCFLKLDYIGDSARLYSVSENGKTLIADNFYVGKNYDWEIGLKRFMNQNIDFSNLELEIKPLMPDSEIYLEKWPELSAEGTAKLIGTIADFEASYEL